MEKVKEKKMDKRLEIVVEFTEIWTTGKERKMTMAKCKNRKDLYRQGIDVKWKKDERERGKVYETTKEARKKG